MQKLIRIVRTETPPGSSVFKDILTYSIFIARFWRFELAKQ